jgi:hypothetical protein
MKLFGVNVDSLLTPEVRYLMTSTSFLPSRDEERPSIYSLDEGGRVIRELIILRESKLPGRRPQPGYKVKVEVKGDGRLSSLGGTNSLSVSLRAKNIREWLSADLIFQAGYINPSVTLIVRDVPVLANDEGELQTQVINFLREWGIKAEKLPVTLNYVPPGKKVKSRLIDIDYLSLAFSPKFSSDLARDLFG